MTLLSSPLIFCYDEVRKKWHQTLLGSVSLVNLQLGSHTQQRLVAFASSFLLPGGLMLVNGCAIHPHSHILYTHSVYYRVYDWKMRYLARLTLIIKLGKQHRKDFARVDIQGIHTLQVRSARLSKPSTSKVICLHGIYCSRGFMVTSNFYRPKKASNSELTHLLLDVAFTRHSSWSHQMVSCDQNSCWRFRQLEAWSSLASGFVYLYTRHAYIHRSNTSKKKAQFASAGTKKKYFHCLGLTVDHWLRNQIHLSHTNTNTVYPKYHWSTFWGTSFTTSLSHYRKSFTELVHATKIYGGNCAHHLSRSFVPAAPQTTPIVTHRHVHCTLCI